MQPKVYKPKKKVDKDGYDSDGVQHVDCGTPECCGGCETSEDEQFEKFIENKGRPDGFVFNRAKENGGI